MTTQVNAPAPQRNDAPRHSSPGASGRLGPLVVKIILLGGFNAMLVTLLFILAQRSSWTVLALAVAAGALINWIYLGRRHVPAKYITPGLVFLAIFQVFVLLYTVYVATTNYSTGHVLSKDQAIQSLLSQSQSRVEDSPTFAVTIVDTGEQLGMLATSPEGLALFGTADEPLREVEAVFENGKAVSFDGARSLTFADVLGRQDEVFALWVPFSDDAADGSLRTLDGRSAYQYTSNLEYDREVGTLTHTVTGIVYVDNGNGAFEDPEGNQILPGWTINVGLDNFHRAFTDTSILKPLGYVTVWTFTFAFFSMFLTFALGLATALLLNKPGMRGLKVYRVIMVLPYAFPAFLSAMVWAGMLSTSFGFVNQVILGGASIPWLTDPTLAKVALLMVNLWLGYPYMFLITLGALQSIPSELSEAARTDGANPWQTFTRIKLPLLLVSVAPVLISTFAFNFNNFNVIYLLTGGGPRDTSAGIPVGHTDILISMVYKVAFTGQQRDYGLASAFSIIIFILVAAISIISFRRTRSLEDIN